MVLGGYSVFLSWSLIMRNTFSWPCQRIWWIVRTKSLQWCLTLGNFMGCSPPGSSVHGILQAGTLDWAAISFSRWIIISTKQLAFWNLVQSRCLLSISSVDKIKLKGTFRNNGNIITVKCVEERNICCSTFQQLFSKNRSTTYRHGQWLKRNVI